MECNAQQNQLVHHYLLRRYFVNVVEQRLAADDNVLILTHEPIWLLEWYYQAHYTSMHSSEIFRQSRNTERKWRWYGMYVSDKIGHAILALLSSFRIKLEKI
eukprot:1159972-Pelagomonas_calceolata.AAC.14